MSSVTLTAATRQNLLSLQDTAALTATTQNRLSTGKKVSSALDNPINFFTAQSLDQRSGDLSSLLDGISNGVQTIQAANQGITSIQKLVDQAKSVANQALATQITTTGTATSNFAAPAGATTLNLYVNGSATTVSLSSTDTIDTAIAALNTAVGSGSFSKDTTGKKIILNASSDVEFKTTGDQTALGFTVGSGATTSYGSASAVGQASELTVSGVSTRNSLATQYNSLLTQIDQLASDASYNGTNLIAGAGANNDLTIKFNPKGNSNLTVTATNETSSGLSLSAITAGASGTGNFLLNTDINKTLTKIEGASSKLRTDASTFGSNLSVVQNRQDFTKHLINVLDTGSSNLTSADLNEEAANSQALTTRQSLGISALSLANQAQQGILQLLR